MTQQTAAAVHEAETQKAVAPLRRLAHLCGVQGSYVDVSGHRHVASPEAIMAVLRSMGLPIDHPREAAELHRRLAAERARRVIEPVLVWWTDEAPTGIDLANLDGAAEIELTEENGRMRSWAVDGRAVLLEKPDRGSVVTWRGLPQDVGIGRHSITVRTGDVEHRATLLAAPRRCTTVSHAREPPVGVFLPLYAAHSGASAGIGDLADLRELARWAGGHGCRYFGTLPLLACFLDEPLEPSPYAPISRIVFGEVFLSIGRDEQRLPADAQRLLDSPEMQAELKALRRGDTVDYARTWRFKRRVLSVLAEAAFGSERVRREIEAFGRSSVAGRYARFRGAMTRLGSAGGVWRSWPEAARRGVLRDEEVDEDERRLFLYAQWRLEAKLEELRASAGAAGCSLYMDLPIGVHRDGFDVWERQALFASEAQVGAPPDAFFAEGQGWGFPPIKPDESRFEGHAYFRACVEAHVRYAGALRIDHVAGLHRCFWTPEGFSPRDGVYVRYPAEELYAVLAIASHRHGAAMIGENLGTVPREVNRALRRHAVLGMRIAQFDLGAAEDPLPRGGGGDLCALNTHDLATFAAYWTGADIELNRDLHLFDEVRAEEERRGRASVRAVVREALALTAEEASDPVLVARAVLAAMLGRRAEAMLINLEDLWGEVRPHNVPGMAYSLTWRRRSARSVEAIIADPFLARVIELFTRAGVSGGANGGAGASPFRGRTGPGSQER